MLRFANSISGLIFLLSVLLPVSLQATDLSSIKVISMLQGPIRFDGIPDEDAWRGIHPFQMVTHSPVYGLEPTEQTEVRVAYDHEYIYIGASFYTKDASLIQASTKKRDDIGEENDWLGVLLDTYNDNENAVLFWTNPAGIRTDMTVSNDGVPAQRGEEPMNSSWNTFWDVETRTTDDGWFVEMRIPVSSLRFQEVNGEVTMGLILVRRVPYLNETYIFPGIPNEYGAWSFMKVSRAQKVVFRGLESRRPLYVSPYVIGGVTQMNEFNDTKAEYDYSREEKFDAGLDLKYGVSSNLTLDVTLNTDFAQVEADDEQVNLTRFSLFYEEKRQFFLERASLFDFNVGGNNTVFYSRRIGLDDDFNPVPIIGGLRFVGRKGSWDAGFLNMQTAKSKNLPSENFGVLRLKRKVLNDYSYLGGVITSRLGMDGSYNEAYGLDALIRVTGDEYLKLIWVQTYATGLDNNPFSIKNVRYFINWERRKNVGFYYDFKLTGKGPEYQPGIGYHRRENYYYGGATLNYAWLMGEDSPIINHGPGFRVLNFISQTRGLFESINSEFFYEINFKNSFFLSAGLNYNYEHVFDLFRISDDTYVPVGEYVYPDLTATLRTAMTRPLWTEFLFEGGSYYDGRYMSVTLMPSWSLSSSLKLSGAYIFNKVDFSERNQHFLGHIGRLKALYMFNTKLSASAFLQYNSAIYTASSNIRLHYNPREGNDLYLVYNEGTNTDLERNSLEVPRMADRTLMLKYTYTFRL